MGFFDKLFGTSRRGPQDYAQQGYQQGYGSQGYQGAGQGYSQQYGQPQYGRGQSAPRSADEQAVRRYQYLLQTAPPEQIEKAHEEAFAALTPQQRQMVLQQLSQADPAERPRDDSPLSLARSATRMEMRRPGTLFSTFGGMGMGGLGMGGMGMGRMGGMGMGMGGMLLTSVAGAFIGTAIADEMFDHDGFMDWDTSHDMNGDAFAGGFDGNGYDDNGVDQGGFDQGNADQVGFDQGGFGGGDSGFSDLGGGDFGGGDFGGGDF